MQSKCVRLFVSFLVLVFTARTATASYSCPQHTIKQAANGAPTTVTTDPIDTTGLDTVIIGVSDFSAGTPDGAWITDTSSGGSNSFGQLSGAAAVGTTNTRVRVYYCRGCVVGTGHTFTYAAPATSVATYPTIMVLACSGGNMVAITDQQNGATTTSAATLATGSVTPTEDNELVVTVVASLDSGVLTAPTGYTLADRASYAAGIAIGGALAYRIQTTATATNPSWTFSTTTEASAGVGSFKAAAGGGGGGITCLSGIGFTGMVCR
jgi:hypothetical protein